MKIYKKSLKSSFTLTILLYNVSLVYKFSVLILAVLFGFQLPKITPSTARKTTNKENTF